MKSREQTKTNEDKIQTALGRYLNLRSSNESPSNMQHLDEDSLSAFTEGNLSLREAQPIVSHLVDCSFCRHITADLVRLDLAFADAEPIPGQVLASEPSKISEVLSGLLSRIFGAGGSAVFAHEDPKKDDNKDTDEEDSSKKESDK